MWKKKKARMISMTPMSLFDNDVFSSLDVQRSFYTSVYKSIFILFLEFDLKVLFE
jgi:hypothetical protein